MPTFPQLGLACISLLLASCAAPPRTVEPRALPHASAAPAPELAPEIPYPDLSFRAPAPAPHAPEPEEDSSGEALALEIAAQLLEGPAAEDGPALPPPRSEADNNPFALVRRADELAAEEPGFALSPDEKRVAFVRKEGDSFPELWLADADGANARRLVDLRSSQAALPEGESGPIPSGSLFSPAFSADGRRVYFQTDGWATSLALYSVDLKDGSIRFVTDANGYFVIHECSDKSLDGRLIAYRHSYSELPASAVDWFFLLDPSGKKLGVVGDTLEGVDRFLEKRCGLGRTPARLKTMPGCDGEVLRYEPRRFLDGSVLELFYWVSRKDARRPLRGTWEDGEWLGVPMGPSEAEASLAERCGK